MSIFPEEVLAATEEACQRQALHARTRMALLRLEQEGQRAGWDSEASRPTIYRVDRDPVRGYVRLRVSAELTEGLELALMRGGGEVGHALYHVANALAYAREHAEGCGQVRPDDDIPFDGPTGPGFYGYAMRNEGWTFPCAEEPERLEARMVHAVLRDGCSWWVMRRRERPPVEAAMMLPEADYAPGGLVLNALGRLVNAICGNPVPVPSTYDGLDAAVRVRP